MIDDSGISCEITVRWMSMDLTDDKSILVQVMAWCRQTTSHYRTQCWPRSMPPYSVIRPQWVNRCWGNNMIAPGPVKQPRILGNEQKDIGQWTEGYWEMNRRILGNDQKDIGKWTEGYREMNQMNSTRIVNKIITKQGTTPCTYLMGFTVDAIECHHIKRMREYRLTGKRGVCVCVYARVYGTYMYIGQEMTWKCSSAATMYMLFQLIHC